MIIVKSIMKSKPILMKPFLLLLLLLITTSLTVSYGQDADACVICACDPEVCDLNYRVCCFRFDTRRLVRLRVSVNCSQPGHSHIIDPVESVSGLVHEPSVCSGFNLVHIDSCLTEFPDGYCKLPAMRAIDLSKNSLSRFPDLQCLPLLGRLDLSHNKLTAIPRGAFKGLTHIREIFLDNNDISYIHPHAFVENLTQLSIFSASYNKLLVFELAWPAAIHHHFCYFSVDHNLVHNFTNQGQWKLNMSHSYGPGFVDFKYNRVEYGPTGHTLTQYGITSILHLAKLVHWGFDFRHNPLRCDCRMYEAVKWVKRLAVIIWRDYFNITCMSPPELHGLPTLQLPLTAFVCSLTVHCPASCHCQAQPATQAINIFCDHLDLQALPEALPEGKPLVIHMANNSLDILQPRHYLERTKRIDLRGNGLRVIHKDTPHLLRKAKMVDLRDNDLHHLPSTLQVLDPGVVLLDLHTLKCSCDLTWMSAWLQHSVNHSLTNMKCSKEGREVLLIEATQDDLCDEKPTPHHTTLKVSLTVVLVSLTVVVVILLVFRYETQILVYRFRAHYIQPQKNEHLALLNIPQFDVFISVNSDSHSDTDWVNKTLLPRLDVRGLSSYLPLRDCRLGSVEMDELTKRMQGSAAVLVVLSPDYVQSPACLSQFRAAYNHRVSTRQGSLLLIKRGGPLSRSSACEPHLRAMLTLRMFYTSEPDQLDKALNSLNTDQEDEL